MTKFVETDESFTDETVSRPSAQQLEISCKERELGFAEQALLESDDQLRRFIGGLDATASGTAGAIKPVEMARLVDSALSLNLRLRDQAKNLDTQLKLLKARAKTRFTH